MPSESCFIRAKDLRPGDMIQPDGRILKVQVNPQTVVVVAQRGGFVSVRTMRSPDEWVEIMTDKEIKHE